MYIIQYTVFVLIDMQKFLNLVRFINSNLDPAKDRLFGWLVGKPS